MMQQSSVYIRVLKSYPQSRQMQHQMDEENLLHHISVEFQTVT
jgi:hypothetical protein